VQRNKLQTKQSTMNIRSLDGGICYVLFVNSMFVFYRSDVLEINEITLAVKVPAYTLP